MSQITMIGKLAPKSDISKKTTWLKASARGRIALSKASSILNTSKSVAKKGRYH